MKIFTTVLIVLIVCFVAGALFYKHSGYFLYSHRPMQYMPNMHRTPALIPQRGYDFYKDRLGARTPPAGTVSREEIFYPYPSDVRAENVVRFKNPFPATKEIVLRGRHIYSTYCVVCHGEQGDGKGYIVPPFPLPPSLLSEKIRNFADSQIFHIVTRGQNVMSSYASQIREDDRWAATHYVRVLQKANDPTPADWDAYEKSQQGGTQ